jgi:signal peptidase I
MNAPDNASITPPDIRPAFSRGKRQTKVLVCAALWSVIFYLFISHFVLMAVEIKGTSMSPTLLDGDRYILFRCPYLWRAPRVGEIVVIKDPQDQDLSIKRIVGLPNDLIEIRKDGVYVNKRKLSEPYLTSLAALSSGIQPVKPIHLGPHQYFVLGDNRFRSADSRIYGPVQRDSILGLISKS